MRGYFIALRVSGMLKGKMDGVASSVHYDDTTMSADDVADGVLICRVGVAALNPSEFAHFRSAFVSYLLVILPIAICGEKVKLVPIDPSTPPRLPAANQFREWGSDLRRLFYRPPAVRLFLSGYDLEQC